MTLYISCYFKKNNNNKDNKDYKKNKNHKDVKVIDDNINQDKLIDHVIYY